MAKMQPEPYKRLIELSRAVTTSLNSDEVLKLIADRAAELTDATVTAVLMKQANDGFSIRASRGIDSLPISGVVVSSEQDGLEKLRKAFPSCEWASHPIATYALLLVGRPKPFDRDEEWQLSAFAEQAAISLENAKMFEMESSKARSNVNYQFTAVPQSPEILNDILENITDLFYSLDSNWRFTHVNREAKTRFGRSREELIGKVIWELYPAAVETPLYIQLQRAFAEMTVAHFETQSITGPETWFEVHAYPFPEGINVYLRDITQRRLADVTARHLAAIVESSDDAIISKDLNGIIKSWNSSAQRIFGYSAEETIGRSVVMLMPLDRHNEEPAILERLRRGERVDHYETVRQHKDGSLIDISLTTSPIRDKDGRIIGASKIARDISDRKKRESEVRFQAHLLGAVEQAVIATDLDGTITFWNAFAETLYGWPHSEAIGQNVLDLMPAAGMREAAAEILNRIKEGESWSGEFQMRRKDGTTFPAVTTNSPIFGDRGELIGIVGVSVDISREKIAEAERARLLESERQARTEAEAANRLKDEFLATLSHELRNPLNVILGYSEVLLRSNEAIESPFIRRTGETLRRNALAQAQLVRDLLDLSRLHMGKLSLQLEPVSLPQTIRNAVETVRNEAATKEIRLVIDIEGDETVVVTADSLRLEQVIWNLLNNAVKFTPPEGEVKISLNQDDGDAVIVVSDTGQGIDPKFLPNIWEMFRQADASSSRRHGGMGIGLALVSQLVELHSGSVSVTSDGVGTGAQFTIRIPLASETPQLKSVTDVQRDVLSGMRVLVVDDSADTVEMLRRLLEMDGAVVTAAASGSTALSIARGHDFDVILSDISMPEMDGFEFLRQLRALPGKADVPVLALTGFGRAEDVQRAEHEGFFSHVTKPIDLDELVETLREIPAKTR